MEFPPVQDGEAWLGSQYWAEPQQLLGTNCRNSRGQIWPQLRIGAKKRMGKHSA